TNSPNPASSLKGSSEHWRHRLRHVLPYVSNHRFDFVVGFLLLALTNASAAAIPYLLKLTTNAMTSALGPGGVAPLTLGLILLALVNAMVRIHARTHIFGIGRRVEFELRQRYHAHLLELDAPFFDGEKTGDLVARGNNDITSIRMFVGPGFLQVSNTIMVYAITLPVMLGLDIQLTLLVLSPFPIVLGGARILTKRLYRLSRKVADSFGELSSFVQESITGMAVIRTHAREEDWCQQFSQAAHHLYDANMNHARLQSMFAPMTMLSGGIGAVLLLTFGGQEVAQGRLTVGDFVAFSGYLAILIWPTVGLGWILTVMQRGLAALERVGQILDAQPFLVEVPQPGPAHAPHNRWRGAISIKNLDFAFKNGPPILNAIHMDITPGSFVGLVGQVGSGKSTLLHGLARLYPLPEGRVQMDDKDLAGVPEESLRANLAMAPQESFLFATTLRENLDPKDRKLDDTTLWSALRMVALDREVAEFPHGLDSVLGERGITLSGGQRQRVALARLLLADPVVLLLDDVFSNCDAQTEEIILRNLKTLAGQRTIVMVCHRVAALHHADCIYLLDRGRIIASGNHSQLMSISPLYQNLHRMMARKEALHSIAAVAVERLPDGPQERSL
ncbi:MAG TPA: ABC transporter ATP-binding protein, partial [Magnetococcales bacterium]|nr:ABC transporter ATP-binding protein [Magnetococcales bacterium]